MWVLRITKRYLRRHYIIGNVPDAITVDASVNSDVQLCAIRQSDTLQFGSRGTDYLVFVLIASLPYDHVAETVTHKTRFRIVILRNKTFRQDHH